MQFVPLVFFRMFVSYEFIPLVFFRIFLASTSYSISISYSISYSHTNLYDGITHL